MPADAHLSAQFAEAARLYGAGDVSAMFPAQHGIGTTPWPRPGRRKGDPTYDPKRVAAVLREPPVLEDFDPRALHATQGGLVRTHVEYYMGDQYERTGAPSADAGNPGNRFPVVYSHPTRGDIILAGHHRAAAALLKGQPLRARRVQG